ncbi:MAG: GNAT family N-acetyltransferase [Clostridia bacterium]|nr:GNAT family N-acetyltransferase [Clostridia bacterium]
MLLRHFQKPAYSDGVIDLYPVWHSLAGEEPEFGDVYDYVITERGRTREIGRVEARLGESECLYYFGHVGYHIDPPWRGHHYAARACRLIAGVFRRAGFTSVVITCDPDNTASRRTCESLGCERERTVAVPARVRNRWEISAEKHRYIWDLRGGAPE